MNFLQTERLILREFVAQDADFICVLLNTPGWLQYIGNRSIYTAENAIAYIERLTKSYTEFGFGLYAIDLKDEATTIGMCGLIRRDVLPDVDIGFALLPEYEGKGYAFESATAILHHAHHALGFQRIAAITAPDNHLSIRLLEKLGLRFERMIRLPDEEEDTAYFVIE